MLEMRPRCECCEVDLPAEQGGAFICSFECTYCQRCAEHTLHGVCPNCQGSLVARPPRAAPLLAAYPASLGGRNDGTQRRRLERDQFSRKHRDASSLVIPAQAGIQ